MSELQCPECGGTNIAQEKRLQNPGSNSSVGTWRIGCGYVFGVLAVLFGIFNLVISRYWLDITLAEPARMIAILAFIFGVVVILITIRFSTWSSYRSYTCKDCGHTWSLAADGDKQDTSPSGLEQT